MFSLPNAKKMVSGIRHLVLLRANRGIFDPKEGPQNLFPMFRERSGIRGRTYAQKIPKDIPKSGDLAVETFLEGFVCFFFEVEEK